MVKNSTKLFVACIVLGVVNQACALVPAERPALFVKQDRFAPRTDGTYARAMRVGSGPAASPILLAQNATAASPETKSDAAAAAPTVATPAVATETSSSPKTENAERNPQSAPPGNASSPDTTYEAVAHPATEEPAPAAESGTPTEPAMVNSENGNERTTASPVPLPAPDQPVYSDSPKAQQFENLWDRIRAGFSMPDVESPRVEAHLAAYLNSPEYFQRVLTRSRRYLHYIVEEVEKRDMPLEIALLPMIESAFNPVAYSRAHASGIWQFIPETGKRYGLKQTFWYDGRRDVTAATKAALDYLQKLHRDFGDWQLALAAYNSGEGAVGRAVRANRLVGRDTSYVHLNLPRETRNYLPKLQAVKNIIAEPERYGFYLEEIPNQPYFTKVKANRTMDMRRAAQLADMPLEEFRSLNAGHNRPVISSRDGHSILVPVDKAEAFSTNVQTVVASSQPLVTWQTYTMRARENLQQVATRFGIDVETLKRVNGIGVKKRPRPGHALLVPMINPAMETNVDTHYNTLQAQPAPVDEPPQMIGYRVRAGETLKGIADRHNVSVAQLMRWNKMKVARVQPGQQLKLIPGPAKTSKAHSRAKVKVAAKASKSTTAQAKVQKRTVAKR